MPEPDLRAAIFDLGGVLTSPVLPSFAEFERSLGLPENALVSIFVENYTRTDAESDFHLLETGKITETEYYRRLERLLCERTATDVRLPSDPADVRRGLMGWVGRNEPMVAAATDIARHYTAGLLTNNVKEWGAWRDAFPVESFAAVVDSCEVGIRKPDPAIFLIACERLDIRPHEAAFVDDVRHNVRAAERLGMHGIHFTDNETALDRLRALVPRAFDGVAAQGGAS